MFGFTYFAVPDGGVSFLIKFRLLYIDVIHYCLLSFYCFMYRASCSVCFYLDPQYTCCVLVCLVNKLHNIPIYCEKASKSIGRIIETTAVIVNIAISVTSALLSVHMLHVGSSGRILKKFYICVFLKNLSRKFSST